MSRQIYKSYGFLMHVSSQCQPLQLSPGETLISEGETADCMYFIVEGTLNIIVGGQQVTTSNAHEVCVGELGLTTNERVHTATVEAASPCKLLKLREGHYSSSFRRKNG